MAADRIAVLGAGSVGCFIGGCWQAAGLAVTLIGRPRIGADLAAHGLTVSDYSGWQRDLPPDAVDYRIEPDALGGAARILVAVKSGATAAAADAIASHGRPGATVISFQNGISNVDLLEHRLGGRFEVLRGIVPFNVAYLGNGRFHKGVAGKLTVAGAPSTKELARAVGDGPAALELADDMLGLAWGKLLINLNNAVNALSGRTLMEELRERDYRRVFAGSIREGLKLLRSAHIRPAKVGPVPPSLLPWVIGSPDWLFRGLVMHSWKIDAKARSSMADDLAAGRGTEIDYLNGELVRLAGRIGRDAPVNRRIVDLVHQAEAGARPMQPSELRRMALGGG